MLNSRFLMGSVIMVFFVSALFFPAWAGEGGKVEEVPKIKEDIPKDSGKTADRKIDSGGNTEKWTISGVNTLRYEKWDTFLPKASTLDNDYGFTADRFALSFKYQNSWTTFNATLNAVKFFGLPKTGSGGTGPLYYVQNDSNSDFSKVYFHTLNFSFKQVGDQGLSATIGRFAYGNGTEFKGENSKVEWVKINRIADRVFGPFGWSLYQRSMNGLLLKRDNGKFHAAASAWYPTAGGFSKQAGDIMEDVRVFTLAGTFKYDKFIPNQELQLFFYNYDDDRPVIGARGDNSLNASKTAMISTNGVSVDIKNYGFSLAGVYDNLRNSIDTLLWVIFQRGKWYELDHKANAFAIEAGYQWKRAPWAPWIRAGLNQSSGDANANDGEHNTFFQMLPTARQYSWSTGYNLMNIKDAFVQLILKPNKKLVVRTDYHRLNLTESADRWYFGGGATAETGAATGFGARNTLGSDDLGSVIETQGTYTFNKEFSAILYLSKFNGGTASKNIFAGESDQIFSYLEVVYNF